MKKLFTVLGIFSLVIGNLFALNSGNNLSIDVKASQEEKSPDFIIMYGDSSQAADTGELGLFNVSSNTNGTLDFSENTQTDAFTITLAKNINLRDETDYFISIEPGFFIGQTNSGEIILTDYPITVRQPSNQVTTATALNFVFAPASSDNAIATIERSYAQGLTKSDSDEAIFGRFYLDWDGSDSIVATEYSSTITITITQA